MSKKLKDLKWESVAVEGFPISVTDKLGFVALEECTTYGLDKENKRSKKKPKPKKPTKKHQNSDLTLEIEVPNKKFKLSNGFVVESCITATPSHTNEETKHATKIPEPNNVKIKKVSENMVQKDSLKTTNEKNKKKAKLGQRTEEAVTNLTPEDMLSWAEFKLPEPILKALTEMGFSKPTKIQQMSLPAAIHGRRDILGAAETGSGKTLAFGLPILTGILKLKEKAELKGLDVYDIPYKKVTNKKKVENEPMKDKKRNKKHTKKFEKAKDSSEDGYESGEDSENAEIEETKSDNEKDMDSEEDGLRISNNDTDSDKETENSSKDLSDDEFIEEIDVPIRKRNQENEEDNNSDDNYVHLSDMLDSDDLADTDNDSKADEGVGDTKSEGDVSGEDENIEGEELDENEQGIGCVKVIDNIEIPGHMVMKTGKPLYALILTPTRELAMQISQHLISVAKYTGIRIATIVGGMASVKQERVLSKGPEIVVATPGRLWELAAHTPHLQQLHTVKFLAIDETDRMIERGHFEELQPLLERLNADEQRRGTRQNFVFSATLTMVHDLPTHMKGKKVTKRGKILNRKVNKMTPQQKIKRLVDMIGMTEPKVVDITTRNSGTAAALTESKIACSFEMKDVYLYYILKRHPGRTIVFCNSIGCVKRLAQLFTILKCRPLPLHASMIQKQRLKNLERFRDDPSGVLIATDVAARGLDIPDVDHVVHYQVPRTAENYVHRSGRTARAHKEGLTILLMEPAEAHLYSKLCRTLNNTAEVPTFPVNALTMSPLKELVTLARDIDQLELQKKRAAQALGWRDKAAREMDMLIDDDDVPVQKADPSIDKALNAKRRQLNAAMSRPLFPRGFSFKYPTLNHPDALACTEENALQVMKTAIESGLLKKQKRKGKNEPLLKLEKEFSKDNNKFKKSKNRGANAVLQSH